MYLSTSFSYCADWHRRTKTISPGTPDLRDSIPSMLFSWEAGAGVVDDGTGRAAEVHDQKLGALLAFTQDIQSRRPSIGPNGGLDWGDQFLNGYYLKPPNTGQNDVWSVAIVWQYPFPAATTWGQYMDFVGGSNAADRLTTMHGANSFWSLAAAQKLYKNNAETSAWLPFSRGLFLYEQTDPARPVTLSAFGNGRGTALDRGIVGEILAIYAFGGPTGSGVVLPSATERTTLQAHTEQLFGPFS